MSNISVDYDILNQKQTPAFYASSLATRPAFGFPGRIFIDTDTPSSGIYRDTGSAWVQVADPGAGTTGTLQQVTTNGNTTTNSIQVQGIDFSDGAGTGLYNIAIGNQTMGANTTGNNNIGIGYQTFKFNTTGNLNVAVGNTALVNNTTGAQNTAIGQLALNVNTTGSQNTALGNATLQNNTTGTGNTAIGHASLVANTTGEYNVAIGFDSLRANTTGIDNTAIGTQSLQSNTTGSLNTAIGFSSLQANTTGTNNTSIGSNSLKANTNGADNVAVGQSSLKANTTGTGNTAIGSTAGGSITTGSNNTILGNYTGTSTLASNIVLSDGAGNVRYQFDGTNNVFGDNIITPQVRASTSAGLSINANSGTQVADFGAGGSANITFFGGLSGTSASFSSSVTLSASNGAIDVGGEGIIRGNGSIFRTHEFTTGAVNVALYNQRNAVGTILNQINAGGFSYINGGNLVIGSTTDDTINKLQVNGSTATTGIKFPATQIPSADVNVLDDYEEGTFTPLLKFGGNSVGMTYFDNIGNYTKIGRQVTVQIYLALTNIGSSTGNATIIDLPFTSGSGNRAFQSVGSIRFDNIIYTGMIDIYVSAVSSSISFEQVSNLGVDSALTNTNFNSSTEMSITLTYFT